MLGMLAAQPNTLQRLTFGSRSGGWAPLSGETVALAGHFSGLRTLGLWQLSYFLNDALLARTLRQLPQLQVCMVDTIP